MPALPRDSAPPALFARIKKDSLPKQAVVLMQAHASHAHCANAAVKMAA